MSRLRTFSRWTCYLHLWLGLLTTAVVLLVSQTGILLNHKRPLARRLGGRPSRAGCRGTLVAGAGRVFGEAIGAALPARRCRS